jgi:beta-glucuronidase
MDTRFYRHVTRSVVDLSGLWDFAFLGDKDPDRVKIDRVRYNDQLPVPGCFDASPAYAGKRGLAAYRTTIDIADGSPHRLVLDGVHHWCRVFVDSKALLDHAGGFTRFNVDLPRLSAGAHELVVLVDNTFSDRSPLHLEYFDWYHYGGIARPAELHRLGQTWIDQLRVRTVDYRSRSVSVEIDWASTAKAGGKLDLEITVGSERILREKVAVDAKSGTIERSFKLKGAALWSPDKPNLHTLRVALGEDDWVERLGIRQVQTRGREVRINGKPLRLLGFCRHEAHPQFGHAIPEALMVNDIQQLRDMGCNFIRGSHYPQDRRFLDLCDRMGMLVWCETIGWGQTGQQLKNPAFMAGQMLQVDEMVAAAANHPSVMMWGVLNEGPSSDELVVDEYRQLLSRLKQLDPTRPVTYASNRWQADLCFDMADIISINTYPGWYSGDIPAVTERIGQMIAKLRELGQDNKPFIVSEIGAGALYGFRDPHEARWSEQYQVKLLETAIRGLFIDSDRAVGLSIWQYCDMRTSQHPVRSISRPRAFNNKGVVDEYRRPKQAYELVKRLFHELNKGV